MEIIAVLLFIVVVIFARIILNQLEEIYDLKVELEKKNQY